MDLQRYSILNVILINIHLKPLQMGQGLSKADIATRSYLLAAIFSLIKENREMTNAQRNTQQLLADLQIRLGPFLSRLSKRSVTYFHFFHYSTAHHLLL